MNPSATPGWPAATPGWPAATPDWPAATPDWPAATPDWPAAGPPGSWYPAFTAAEMERRRRALAGLLQGRGIDHALLYGADRSGTAIQWVTGWPVTREAAVIVSPGERDVLFVCYNNPVPNARLLAPDADVRPGGGSALAAGLALLASRATAGSRTGVIGPVPARSHDRLLAAAGQVEFLDGEYTRLRLVKSAE